MEEQGRINYNKLKSYKYICKNIEDIAKRIRQQERIIDSLQYDVVVGSLPDFPYTQAHFPIAGYNVDDMAQRNQDTTKMREELRKLKQDKREIESFILSIQDPTLALIFRLLFFDGKKQREVADEIGMDRSRISRKVRDYLKNAHKAQNNML